jgi:hypothetical protein
VSPKAWTVLRVITNAMLDRRWLLRCSWMAEKNCTRSGETGRCRHFRQKATAAYASSSTSRRTRRAYSP